ncbi:MAG: MFS transporter, partial [Polyangiaceae bacterium]
GLTYAFLYMGRYNMTVCAAALGDRISNQQFGTIIASGSITYGLSFWLNGPLTDKFGGRKTIIVAAAGSSLMNIAMGTILTHQTTGSLVLPFSLLYAANMYFQSFGAVSIIKVNSAWFHVRERGTFSGVFGILISLGFYFAFDWGHWIVKNEPIPYVFFIPAAILALLAVADTVLVRDTPGQAGFEDIDTGDASSGDDGERLPAVVIFKKMFRNPVIVTVACVEFCSGYIRDSVMSWYLKFADFTHTSGFASEHWGVLTCCAGITSGVVGGIISDRVFQSRRGPVATVFYCAVIVLSLVMLALLSSPLLGFVAIGIFMSIIGVHGMLSGTASMDFGGKKNAGVAVGIIDGFVYLGVTTQAKVLGFVLPRGDATKMPSSWIAWPCAIVPVSIIGLYLASRLWNAKPKPAAAAAAH